MGKFTLFLVIIYLISAGLVSCTSNNEQEDFNITCDTTLIDRDTITVYYDDLTPIFTGICASCHNSQFSYRQSIRMDNYTNVKKSFETGLPWPAINHSGEYKMPNNLPKLNDCDIQRIGAWVSAGMPEKPKQ